MICYNHIITGFALSCIALSTSALVPIKSCSKSCTNVRVNTICAETSDGERKTFKTKCAMNAFNCNQSTDYSYVMDGPCCAVRCSSDVYEPICAEDLNGVRRTFTSQCQLSGLICNEGIGKFLSVLNSYIFFNRGYSQISLMLVMVLVVL